MPSLCTVEDCKKKVHSNSHSQCRAIVSDCSFSAHRPQVHMADRLAAAGEETILPSSLFCLLFYFFYYGQAIGVDEEHQLGLWVLHNISCDVHVELPPNSVCTLKEHVFIPAICRHKNSLISRALENVKYLLRNEYFASSMSPVRIAKATTKF